MMYTYTYLYIYVYINVTHVCNLGTYSIHVLWSVCSPLGGGAHLLKNRPVLTCVSYESTAYCILKKNVHTIGEWICNIHDHTNNITNNNDTDKVFA